MGEVTISGLIILLLVVLGSGTLPMLLAVSSLYQEGHCAFYVLTAKDHHIPNIAIIPYCPSVVCGHLIIVVRLPQTCVYMPHMPQTCLYMPHMPHSDLIIRLSSRSWAHHRCFTLPPSVTPLLFLSLSPQLLEPPRIGAHLEEFTVFPPFFLRPFENFCKLAQTMKAVGLRA